MQDIQPGLVGRASGIVEESRTAPAMNSGDVPVFATPALAALMEEAAVAALAGRITPGETSVGVALDIEHVAPTLPGRPVRAQAEIAEVSGRRVTFLVEARDDYGLVGKGRHKRVVLDRARFMASAAAREQTGDGGAG